MSPLSSPSSFLLFSFGSALSDFAFLPLNGFWARITPKLWLQLDHAGPDGVAFPTGLVALIPLGPIRDHAVNGWIGTKQTNVCDTGCLQQILLSKMELTDISLFFFFKISFDQKKEST